MRRLRILVLMHKDLVPPEQLNGQDLEAAAWKTEYDVVSTLRKLGHEVRALGVKSDLEVIRAAVEDWKPHIAFNLLEEFDGMAVYDQNVVSYLELMRIPYTGCNPRGLMLARDKALAKQVMSYHRIPYPEFMVVPLHRMVRRPKYLPFPLIVKSVSEEASLGISQASIVEDDEKLRERVAFIHDNVGTGALVERYIEGRELYVGVMGNAAFASLPGLGIDDGQDAGRSEAHRDRTCEMEPQISGEVWHPIVRSEKFAGGSRRPHSAPGQARLPRVGAQRLCPDRHADG